MRRRQIADAKLRPGVQPRTEPDAMKSPRTPWVLHLPLAATLLALGAGPAVAETNPYFLGLVQSFGHESNLYRIGDNQPLPAGLSKSDSISATSLFAGVDQSLGRQRIYGSLNLKTNRYASNKALNNTSHGLNLALDWSTTGRLSGMLSVSADQNLAQFNSRNGAGSIETRKNIVRTEQADAKFRLGLVTQYTVEAALGYRQVDYSSVEYQRNQYQQTSHSLGLRYRYNGALNLGSALRLTQVAYPQFRPTSVTTFEADILKRKDLDLTADWVPDAISQVYLRLSPTRSTYDRNTGSNFSGLTGSAAWDWQASGKSKLGTMLWRETGQSAYAANLGFGQPGVVDNSTIGTTLRIKGDHQITAKTTATATMTYAHRSLTDTVTATLLGASTRTDGSDKTATLALGGRWSPTRSAQLGCDVSNIQRSSSNARLSVALRGNSLSCYGQFVLQ